MARDVGHPFVLINPPDVRDLKFAGD